MISIIFPRRNAAMLLPEELEHRVQDWYALTRAKEMGYIVPRKDHWEWTRSKMLLAYFCGCCFAGDMCQYDPVDHAPMWMPGTGRFPDKALTELFQMGSLRSLRKNRLYMKPPEGHRELDVLFNTLPF